MRGEILLKETFQIEAGNFTLAGEASGKIKRALKQLGIDSVIVRRVAIAAYEVELNLVIHSLGGKLILEISKDCVTIISKDIGPGIPDIDKAMQEGFTTASDSVRMMGFGAGMGLPNMKRNATEFSIESEMGVGTTIIMDFSIV